eukprot:COSAG06_NODE_638_length_13527_cov_7.606196_16_plen_100_part_00
MERYPEGVSDADKAKALELAEKMGAVTSYLDDATFTQSAHSVCQSADKMPLGSPDRRGRTGWESDVGLFVHTRKRELHHPHFLRPPPCVGRGTRAEKNS